MLLLVDCLNKVWVQCRLLVMLIWTLKVLRGFTAPPPFPKSEDSKYAEFYVDARTRVVNACTRDEMRARPYDFIRLMRHIFARIFIKIGLMINHYLISTSFIFALFVTLCILEVKMLGFFTLNFIYLLFLQFSL